MLVASRANDETVAVLEPNSRMVLYPMASRLSIQSRVLRMHMRVLSEISSFLGRSFWYKKVSEILQSELFDSSRAIFIHSSAAHYNGISI